jgi:hypothetical protein
MVSFNYSEKRDPKHWANRACKWATAMLASVAVCLPLTTAQADDDDWEDRWEDYREELEDRREEARERWEDRQEAYEEWREDRRERRIVVPRRRGYVRQEYWEPLPPPQYYYEDYGRVYRDHYYTDRPPVYREYYYDRPYGPEYRYYGTPRIGYSEYGRQRSVRVGPLRFYWRR